MNNLEKKQTVKTLVSEMLIESNKSMIEKIDKLINSGCIDIESWDPADRPMILPKCIVAALLEHEQAANYMGNGTSYQKRIKKEVRNIRYFI